MERIYRLTYGPSYEAQELGYLTEDKLNDYLEELFNSTVFRNFVYSHFETLKAEKDGCWVEGFLSIPKTDAEKAMDKMAKQGAQILANMFGGFAMAQQAQAPALSNAETNAFDDAPVEALISDEVAGKTGAKK